MSAQTWARSGARLLSWARALLSRRDAAGDAAEELRFHIDAHAAELVANGVPAAEAHRRAAAAAGQPDNLHERKREALGLRLWDETWADVRYGLRGLWRIPGFAAIAICSLALAIGSATAMFSLVYATVLDAFPYPDADRIVLLTMHVPSDTGDEAEQPVLTAAQRASLMKTGAFADIMGTGMLSTSIKAGNRDYTNILICTPNTGRVLGVKALYGRPLQMSDSAAAAHVVVLNYRYWELVYGGDPQAVGRTFVLGTKRYTIVGVMPRWYNLAGGADVYLPSSQLGSNWSLSVTAQLAPGITKAQASAAIQPVMETIAATNPKGYPAGTSFVLMTLREQYTSTSKFVRSLPMFLLSVTILLLIGCGNCCLLLLARGTARQHEFAIRAAVGSTQARVVRQLLVESLCVSLIGSVGGAILAFALARLPIWLSPGMFPIGSVIRVNLPVLCFATAITILAGLLSGVFPALNASRRPVAAVLQASDRRRYSSRTHRVLSTLMAAQLAFTLVLLTVSAASAAGFVNMLRLRLGFSPQNIAIVEAASGKPLDWAQDQALLRTIHHALANVPGVEQVTENAELPPDAGDRMPVQTSGQSSLNHELVRVNLVGTDYFSTLRMSLLAGHAWSAAEAAEGLPVAVVNQTFARRLTPNRSPIGQVVFLPRLKVWAADKRHHFSASATNGRIEIEGVVADALNMSLDQPLQPEIYLNAGIEPQRAIWFLVRTHTHPATFQTALEKAVEPFEQRDYLVVLPDSLRQNIESSAYWQQQRLVSVLFGVYAGMALVLALVGLYSTAQYIALQRRGELGIRLALGATRAHVRWIVLRGNLLVIGYAAVAGLFFSLLARAGMERWMAGSSQSPVVLIAAAALLVLVAVAACLVPAERASRLNPNEVLRAE